MSTRVLITGASGFAGSHLCELCVGSGDRVTALARSVTSAASGATAVALAGAEPMDVDLLDGDAARAAVAAVAPEVVYHLAALASVGRSWEDPRKALNANATMSLNLLEAVRLEAPGARFVLASSGEIYGPPQRLPVDESAQLRPQNPYAVAKANVDLLAGFYADAHRLAVVRARAFNHAGPRQSTTFAIASFARQAAVALQSDETPIRIVTGNPDARRDFTDVRDVVRAYRMLGVGAPPGIYNVCSGVSASIAEVVAALGEAAGAPIEHVVDEQLRRPHEVPEVRGSFARLAEATGWEPRIPLARTLADTIEWWTRELAGAEA